MSEIEEINDKTYTIYSKLYQLRDDLNRLETGDDFTSVFFLRGTPSKKNIMGNIYNILDVLSDIETMTEAKCRSATYS